MKINKRDTEGKWFKFDEDTEFKVRPFRLSTLPVWKLSSTVTSCALISADTRLDPINPAPPVTSIFIHLRYL